eukprot:1157682-Pelagomonas_calceolata.AAC.3
MPGATTGPSCSRFCLVIAWLSAHHASCSCHSSHSCFPHTISSRPCTRGSLIHEPGQRCRSCSSSHQQTSAH